MTFRDLGLTDNLSSTVEGLGYVNPTPVQEQSIPHVLRGRDILACAQTGTGKTASFLLPLIDILSNSRGRQGLASAIILEPTRELATQVYENFLKYSAGTKLKAISIVGGEVIRSQELQLKKGVDIIIATPGRLIDLFERGKIIFTNMKAVVIDEADRMLDMGFMPDVDRILSLLPKLRQTLMFSATVPDEIRRISQTYQIQPLEIKISRSASTAETIEQEMLKVTEEDKRVALRKILKDQPAKNPVIVFCNRKKDINVLANSLVKHGFSACSLHGDMTQRTRNETLDRFRVAAFQILVTSDVAARGIDITGISLVVNFDVPINAEDYVHRIGRTGRAGQKGHTIMFVTKTEEKRLSGIEKLIKKSIKEIKLNLAEPLEIMHDDYDSDKPVVGFGHHVPAFINVDPLLCLA